MRCMIALLLAVVACTAGRAEPVEADLVLRGGMLYDGAGGAPSAGDVAIRGDRIVAVGKFDVAGNPEVFNAKGLCVAPGFIDLHNHSDDPIAEKATKANLNYLRQGCTSIVTGNCGGGVIDVPKYFATLEANGVGTNVLHLAPQGAIRRKVLGSVDRPPTKEELAKMCELVESAMKAGAFGMSTGLIYVPGTFSTTEEIIELAKVVARHGGIYASHIRDEGAGVLKSIDEAIRIGTEAGCPTHISHLKASGVQAWGLGPDICAMIRAARSKGIAVTADQYPYTASSTSLEATIIPAWAREGGSKKLLERLDDEEQGPKLRVAIAESIERKGQGSHLQIARYGKQPTWAGRTLAEIAKDSDRSPLDVAIEITRGGGASIVNFGMSQEDVRHIAGQDFVATASDGSARVPSDDKPHPRSYGTFTRKIGEYAREQGWLSVEQAIRSSSGLPADILGLKDRGYLRTGYFADVVVFDLKSIKDHATFKEPHQYSTGFARVYVNGKAAIIDDEPTGALAGRPIRHEPKTAPAKS